MATFQMKTHPIEGHKIDAAWLAFLKNEHGYTDVNIDDYVYTNLVGELRVMGKNEFERLFHEVR